MWLYALSIALLVSAFTEGQRIEAEQYQSASGVRLEDCQDKGEGKNLAFISNGDHVTYPVTITKSGYYDFQFRVASKNSESGSIDVQ